MGSHTPERIQSSHRIHSEVQGTFGEKPPDNHRAGVPFLPTAGGQESCPWSPRHEMIISNNMFQVVPVHWITPQEQWGSFLSRNLALLSQSHCWQEASHANLKFLAPSYNYHSTPPDYPQAIMENTRRQSGDRRKENIPNPSAEVEKKRKPQLSNYLTNYLYCHLPFTSTMILYRNMPGQVAACEEQPGSQTSRSFWKLTPLSTTWGF